MTFFLWFLLAMGVIAELMSLYVGIKRIRFQYSPKKEAVEQGEVVPVCVEVKNIGWMPISYLLVKAHFPVAAQLPEQAVVEKDQFHQTADLQFHLWGKEAKKRTVPIRLEKRGVHYLRGATLESTDFVGFRNVFDFYEQQEQVLVYPRCVESQELISAMGEYFGDMIAHRHLLRDPVLTIGVREYTGREPMKTISWAQSARRGQLMVRDFDYTRDLSCTVLLAGDGIMPVDAEKLDRCCALARTVCREMTEHGINVDFFTNCIMEGFGTTKTTVWKTVATPQNQQELLRGLALLAPAPVMFAADVLAVSAVRSVGNNTAFVLVAPNEDASIKRAVRVLEEYSQMRVMLILESDFFEQKGK